MKKIYSAILVLTVLSVSQAFATTHVVTQSSFTFSPNALNVVVGDIIQFQWTGGSHTTTSVSVPAGAASWDAPLTSASPTFEYTVTVEGAYAYVCTPHVGMGMAGGFLATAAVSVPNLSSEVEMNASVMDGGQLRVKLTGASCGFATIGLLDIMGRNVAMMHQGGISSDDFTLRHDVSGLQRGIYFVRLQVGSFVTTRKVLIQ